MPRPPLEWFPDTAAVRLTPPIGLVAAATGVTIDGVILRLFVTQPAPARPRGRTNRQHATAVHAHAAIAKAAVLIKAHGSVLKETVLEGAIAPFTCIDLLPNGDILVVGSRCEYSVNAGPEKNARVYDHKGALLREFTLGDGIAKVQVDEAGEIWVSYFDEGIFGNLGWGESGPRSNPLGFAGLARFDERGNKLWDYEPPPGFGWMADCYALNVCSSGAWAYYYTAFDLVHLSKSGKVRAWHTDRSGGHAVVTDGWRAILFGGYGGARSACVALRLGEKNRADAVADIELRLPKGVALADAMVIGCGDALHVVHGEEAYRFRLGDLLSG